MGQFACVKTHGIVQTSLDVSCSVRSCSVEIRYLDDDRLDAFFEVRTDRHAHHTEFILRSRSNADHRAASINERTNIKRCAAAVWRNPICVCLDQHVQGLHEHFLRNDRDRKSFRGIDHSLRVQVRTECYDLAVFCSVSFEPFKNSLCVLKHAGAFGNVYCWVGNQFQLAPFTILIGSGNTVVGRLILETQAAPINVLSHLFILLSDCFTIVSE